MSEWENSLVSDTPPLYKFELVNTETSESVILPPDEPPIEWADGIIEFNRILDVGGVFTSFSISSLTFIKQGAKFLRDIESDKKINGKAELIISWWKKSTRAYQEFPSRLALNFSQAKPRVKVGQTAIGFNIPAINSSTLTKFDNRKKVKIDITKLFSIGGYNIVDYTDLKKDFRFGEINSYRVAGWGGSGEFNDGTTDVFLSLPTLITLSDFAEAKSRGVGEITNFKDFSTFVESTEDRTIDISIETDYQWVVSSSISSFNYKGTFRFVHVNLAGSVLSNIEISSFNFTNADADITGSLSDSRQITISTGDSWGYFFEIEFISGTRQDDFDLEFIDCIQNASQQISASNPTTVDAFPIYEVGERLCQHILDTQFPFYSEFLARTDVKYNIAGDFYSSESQLRFASIMSGLNIRGSSLSDLNNPLALSWDDYFKTIRSIWNVGYTLEEIDNFIRIRVENYDFFFDDSIVLDISDRIGKYDIESETMPELAYLSFKSGYKNFDYEELNGRGEYNSTNERTSIIETDTNFDNISPVRGDTKGITLQLKRSVTEDGTKDEKEDNDMFIVKSQRSGIMLYDWVAETDENVSIDDNTSLFQEGSLNTYMTPTRNLIRNANRITGAFTKYLSSKLRFQTSDKLQTLKTTGEGYTVTENDDLVINDLADPIFTPKKYSVEVYFDFTDLETIQTNPKGLIKFTDDIQGYILNIKKKNNEDKAVIEIIEKFE